MAEFSHFAGQLASSQVWAIEGNDRIEQQRKEMAHTLLLDMHKPACGSSTFRHAYRLQLP